MRVLANALLRRNRTSHRASKNLARDRSGLAILEFAIIAPVMMLLAFGGFDIARALITWQEVLTAAEFAAVSAQSLAIQPDQSTGLTLQQAQAAMSTIYGNMPQVFSGLWRGKYAINMSGIEFYTVGGTPTPYLAWTTTLFGLAPTETKSNYDTTFKRVCNSTLTPVNTVPTDSTLLSTIPTAQVSAASTFVIVDVEYVFSPLLPGITFVTGPITFQTSYVWPNYIGANNQVLYLDGAPPNTNYNDGYNCGAIPANT